MKIILYKWNANGNDILHRNLTALGHEVTVFDVPRGNLDEDSVFSMKLMELMERTKCEAVFSFNYFPIIADVCQVRSCLYLSWVFDCPHSTLLSKTVFYSTNRIFVFDRNLCQELLAYGIPHIYYMSLAVDTDYFGNTIKSQSMEERAKYSSDISFVGGLYTGEYNFFDQIKYLPEYVRGYLAAIIDAQSLVYGYNFVKEMLTGAVLEEIRQYVKFDFGERYFIPYENMIATMINKKITVKERECVLQMLSRDYDVDLYTGSNPQNLPAVHCRGYVDYDTQMPKVFHDSRINLNITLKSITSGIPLRALDIMGCGGFLLSNYQPELAERFEDGRELVLYTDMEDLRQKVAYYLTHEEERAAIAANGYEKVKQQYSYKKKLCRIFEIINEK